MVFGSDEIQCDSYSETTGAGVTYSTPAGKINPDYPLKGKEKPGVKDLVL